MNEKNYSELNGDQLEKVTGGSGDVTAMECVECGYVINWAGNYLKQVFACPKCGKPNCLLGRSYTPGDGGEESENLIAVDG